MTVTQLLWNTTIEKYLISRRESLSLMCSCMVMRQSHRCYTLYMYCISQYPVPIFLISTIILFVGYSTGVDEKDDTFWSCISRSVMIKCDIFWLSPLTGRADGVFTWGLTHYSNTEYPTTSLGVLTCIYCVVVFMYVISINNLKMIQYYYF